MKIKNLKLGNLRNDEHFEFFQFLVELVRAVTPAKLKITEPYDVVLKLHKQEDEALKKIVKSPLTAQIHDADVERDTAFRGMVNYVKGQTANPVAKTREAAARLMIVFETYGNVAAESYVAESSALYNLLNELAANHQNDFVQIDLEAWITELDRLNIAVEKLLEKRADQAAAQTLPELKKVRAAEDEAYRVLASIVEAYAAMAGLQGTAGAADAAMYDSFIRRLNERIDLLARALARRHGASAKGGGGEEVIIEEKETVIEEAGK